jgi:hypothetical protein
VTQSAAQAAGIDGDVSPRKTTTNQVDVSIDDSAVDFKRGVVRFSRISKE